MALSSSTVWEVRGGAGNDTNGGGFVAGASGTDFSQQDSKRTGTGSNNSTTDAVTNGTTTVTSATAAFTSAIVGNIIYINGARYQVTTYTNATTIVVDRSITAASGLTMNIGGALNTIGVAFTNMASGNAIYVKSATYTLTSAITVSVASFYLYGYSSSRSDKTSATLTGRPTITTATNSTALFSFTTADKTIPVIENFIMSNTASVRAGVISAGASIDANFMIKRVKFSGFTSFYVISTSVGHGYFERCEFDSFTSDVLTSQNSGSAGFGGMVFCKQCYFHDCSGSGVTHNRDNINIFIDCIFDTNSYGINLTGNSPELYVYDCVFYANSNWGIRTIGSTLRSMVVYNSIFYNNTTGDITRSTSASFAADSISHNARNGTYTGISTEIGGVTLTADPFTNAASRDFTLNNTAGGGAACRSAGTPISTNYP